MFINHKILICTAIANILGVVTPGLCGNSVDDTISPQIVSASRNIFVTAEPFHTGTVFADYTSWGSSTGSIFVGKNPEYGNHKAGGWIRFDTSTIPDDVQIQSVVLNFTVHRDDGLGPMVDFMQLGTDPVVLRNFSRWQALRYGKIYVSQALLREGEWTLTLGPDGTRYLQELLVEDWFAVGIRSAMNDSTFAFISGWNDEARPYLEIEYTIPQKIVKVEWEKPLVAKEGETVAMIAEVQGFPVGMLPEWEIWEDGLFQDQKVENPELTVYGVQELNNRYFVRAEWVSDWLLGEDGDGEYYLKIRMGSKTAQSGKNIEEEMIVSRGEDTAPPVPDPALFKTAPFTVSDTEIKMVAAEATDADENGVEYYFYCAENAGQGEDSAWQRSRSFLAKGLIPDSKFGYKVMYRDRSPANNRGQYSEIGFAWTFAATPVAPKFRLVTEYTAKLEIVADDNPDNTEYAVKNLTTNSYTDKYGNFSGKTPRWQQRSKWNGVVVKGLFPGTLYKFAVKARNQRNIETDWSASTIVVTLPSAADLYLSNPEISWSKGTGQTESLNCVVRVVNHPTAGAVTGTWTLSWILTEDEIVGNDDDSVTETRQITDHLRPGKARSYAVALAASERLNNGSAGFIAAVISDVPGERHVANNTFLIPLPSQIIVQ